MGTWNDDAASSFQVPMGGCTRQAACPGAMTGNAPAGLWEGPRAGAVAVQ